MVILLTTICHLATRDHSAFTCCWYPEDLRHYFQLHNTVTRQTLSLCTLSYGC